MFPESSADPIKCDRISAGVEVAQAETYYSEVVPESVVQIPGVWVEIEKQHEHVRRQEAYGEHQDENEDGDGHFLPGTDLEK
mgnify:FL=1